MGDNENTFVMLKPDTIQRNLVDEVLEYFVEEGFDMPMLTGLEVEPELVEEHYSHVPDEVREELHEYFDNEYVVVGVLEGEDAVDRTREIVGDDFRPEHNSFGTIRGDVHNPESDLYSENASYHSEKAEDEDVPLYNLIHASAEQEEALEEIERFLGSRALEYLN